MIEQDRRDVAIANKSALLARCFSHEPLLGDNAQERAHYFASFWKRAEGFELVFFDPDNGLEVQSKPKGRKDSCKFLYWDELAETGRRGHSVLLYQHFGRKERMAFKAELARAIMERTGAGKVYAFATPHVVFFLIPSKERGEYFERKAGEVFATWAEQISPIEVYRHD